MQKTVFGYFYIFITSECVLERSELCRRLYVSGSPAPSCVIVIIVIVIMVIIVIIIIVITVVLNNNPKFKVSAIFCIASVSVQNEKR